MPYLLANFSKKKNNWLTVRSSGHGVHLFAALIVFKSIRQRMISSYLFVKWQYWIMWLLAILANRLEQHCHLANKYEEIIRWIILLNTINAANITEWLYTHHVKKNVVGYLGFITTRIITPHRRRKLMSEAVRYRPGPYSLWITKRRKS